MNFINLKTSFRALLKNKFYSTLSILGVALTFIFLCIVFMYVYMQKGNITPDTNKDKTIAFLEFPLEDGSWKFVDSAMVKHYLALKEPDAIGFMNVQTPWMLHNGRVMCGNVAYTNADFFKIFEFNYLSGRPFTNNEENLQVVVVTERFAENYFGKIEVIGQQVELLEQEFKVVGIVEKPNSYSELGSYDLYIPYAFDKFIPNGIFWHTIYLKAKDVQQLDRVRDELQRLNTELYQQEILKAPPVAHEWLTMKDEVNSFGTLSLSIVVLFLLVIPAFNMLSLNTSKITDQLQEIAIKKAYGATHYKVFSYLFLDNLVLTTIGALIGLLLTKPFLYLINTLVNSLSATSMSLQMDINIPVVGIIILLVVAFSLFSCFIPAWLISGKGIIEGLKGGNGYE